LPRKGVFKAVQVARRDDQRLSEADRVRTESVLIIANRTMGASSGELPRRFGGLEGSQIWNRNAVVDLSGRRTRDGDSEILTVSSLDVLEDEELQKELRWQEAHLANCEYFRGQPSSAIVQCTVAKR